MAESLQLPARGATLPLWSFRDTAAAQESIEALAASGANAVIVDFHLLTDTLTGSSVRWEDASELPNLVNVTRLAHEAGLEVAIKPIVIIGNGGLFWQGLDPLDKENWFAAYEERLSEALEETNGVVDRLLLTNELATLTTDPGNIQHWTSFIAGIRGRFEGEIGFNAGGLLGEAPGQSEFERIPEALSDLVDFHGISAYPRIDGATSSDFAQSWFDDVNGIDQVATLRAFDNRDDKPVFFTELGVASTPGGNPTFYDNPDNRDTFPFDPSYSEAFYQGSFDAFSQNLSGVIDGVFVYSWALRDDLGDDQNYWNVNRQTSETVIADFFTNGFQIETTNFVQEPDTRVLYGTGVDDVITLTVPGSQALGYGGDDRFVVTGTGNTGSPVQRVELSVSSDILDGEAAQLALVINGAVVTTMVLSADPAGSNPDFGDLPFTATQQFSYEYTGEISTLEVMHLNDEYRGFGLDRNATVRSLEVDGTPIPFEALSYFPSFGSSVSGSGLMFDGGRLTISESLLGELAQQSEATRIDGGDGYDVFLLADTRSVYSVRMLEETVELANRAQDTSTPNVLTDIEVFAFSDQDWVVDAFDNVAQLSEVALREFVEVYIAYFNRAPDAEGLFFYGTAFSNGASLEDLAQTFVNSTEYAVTYPAALSNLALATEVYRNVLGRDADQPGLDFWVTLLDSSVVSPGVFIAEVLKGVKAPVPSDADAAFRDQQLLDQAYLASKTDIGLYFAITKGMSNVPNAVATMEVFGDQQVSNVLGAVAAVDNFHVEALDPNNGEFLLELVGVVDNPFPE